MLIMPPHDELPAIWDKWQHWDGRLGWESFQQRAEVMAAGIYAMYMNGATFSITCNGGSLMATTDDGYHHFRLGTHDELENYLIDLIYPALI